MTLALLVSACQKTEPTETTSAAPTPSASIATPIDHLNDGELLEGTENTFGLVLPREVHVVHGFDDLRVATGAPQAERVANYFRARVHEGKITVGARSTVFDGVRIAAAPDIELAINVEPGPGGDGCRVEVRKLTHEKAPVLPDDEARWRAAGLKPNGQPLDPHTMR